LLGLWLAFRRRWALAVTLGLLVGGSLAAAGWFLSPSTHSGRTLVELSAATPSVLNETTLGGSAIDGYQRTQVAMVRSRFVLNKALRDPKVAELPIVREQSDPLAWLEKQVKADFSVAPEIMSISMSGDDPKAVALLLNAIRDAYIKEVVQRDRKLRNERYDDLLKIYTTYDDMVREKRRTLKAMSEDLGSQDLKVLAFHQEFAVRGLSELENQRIRLQSQLRDARLEMTLQGDPDKAAEQPVPEALVEEQVSQHKDILQIREQIALLEKDVVAFEERSPKPQEAPGYQRAQAALKTARQRLADRQAKLKPEIREQLRDQWRRKVQLTRAEYQKKIDLMTALEQQLDTEVKDRLGRTREVGKKSTDVEWIRAEINQYDAMYQRIGDKVQALKIELGAPDRVRHIEEAVVNPPVQGKARNAALLGIAGFGLIIALVSFLEFRARKVTGANEVLGQLPMSLLGTLPLLPARVRNGQLQSGKAGDTFWRNLLIESVDSTRTMVLHTARCHSLQVLMVTSAVGGEGKTMLSSHLVASLARAGRKTLLIDCDLRRPAIQRVFGLADHAGLCELLRHEVTPAEVIQDGPVAGLSLITAGRIDATALQALAMGKLDSVFATLRKEFDFIILDSAPILPVTDSQLIGQCADGVLLAVMCDVSRIPFVAAAYERLVHLNIRILGAVMHGGQNSAHYGGSYHYVHSSPLVEEPAPAEPAPAEEA
jgi:capsular exopolysaccharide synthesis family protein